MGVVLRYEVVKRIQGGGYIGECIGHSFEPKVSARDYYSGKDDYSIIEIKDYTHAGREALRWYTDELSEGQSADDYDKVIKCVEKMQALAEKLEIGCNILYEDQIIEQLDEGGFVDELADDNFVLSHMPDMAELASDLKKYYPSVEITTAETFRLDEIVKISAGDEVFIIHSDENCQQELDAILAKIEKYKKVD